MLRTEGSEAHIITGKRGRWLAQRSSGGGSEKHLILKLFSMQSKAEL